MEVARRPTIVRRALGHPAEWRAYLGRLASEQDEVTSALQQVGEATHEEERWPCNHERAGDERHHEHGGQHAGRGVAHRRPAPVANTPAVVLLIVALLHSVVEIHAADHPPNFVPIASTRLPILP